jgi:DNA helicase-2/ATP-dependent DNA helicase PcrA
VQVRQDAGHHDEDRLRRLRLGIPPRQILAVTFTNKAANEMKERAVSMLPDRPDMKECVIRTFHSFGAWVLRMFSDKAGLSPNFTIYDDDASLEVLRKAYSGYDVKVLRGYAKKISLLKDRGVDPTVIQKGPDQLLWEMYRRYQETLRQTGCVDFADLILRTTELLDDPDVAHWAHNRFRMILVDEYQDTNVMQFRLLQKLAGPQAILCVVGDDDQSIYRFRGAEVGNIDSFRKAYPATRVIKLEQNYRSTPSILNVANSVILHNHKGGDLKKLWTENNDGPKPKLFFLHDEQAEASLVARMIKSQGDYDHTAVLFRTNAQSGLFEQEFVKPGYTIPYKVVGALKFYDREQVKDGLSLMYLLCNPKDVVSFRRMVNKPARGIGKTRLAAIEATAEAADNDYIQALKTAPLSGKAKEGALRFFDLLSECGALLDQAKLSDALQKLFSQSGVIALYTELDKKEGREREGGGRVADFDTLVTQASQYGEDRSALSAFLETLALDTTTIGYLDPADKPGVTLITMHNTKGLEYDNVYVVGLEEGLFPSSMSIDEDPSCEEERRFSTWPSPVPSASWCLPVAGSAACTDRHGTTSQAGSLGRSPTGWWKRTMKTCGPQLPDGTAWVRWRSAGAIAPPPATEPGHGAAVCSPPPVPRCCTKDSDRKPSRSPIPSPIRRRRTGGFSSGESGCSASRMARGTSRRSRRAEAPR